MAGIQNRRSGLAPGLRCGMYAIFSPCLSGVLTESMRSFHAFEGCFEFIGVLLMEQE